MRRKHDPFGEGQPRRLRRKDRLPLEAPPRRTSGDAAAEVVVELVGMAIEFLIGLIERIGHHL